jgi:hypothetical protein
MRDAFLGSESIAEAAVIVEMALTGRLAKALFINSEDIDIAKPLHSYGGMFSNPSNPLIFRPCTDK